MKTVIKVRALIAVTGAMLGLVVAAWQAKADLERDAKSSQATTVVAGSAFTNASFSADTFTFSFLTITGSTYTVDYKDSLIDLAWIFLQSVAGDGGTVTVTNTAPPELATRFYRVRITETSNPIFERAVVVKQGINGIQAEADAYDSSNPSYSTGGQYDPAKAMDGGGVATLSSTANMLNVTNFTIYGPVAVGPGGSINTNFFRIGTHSWLWANPGWGKIQDTMFTRDMNLSFPAVQAPPAGGLPPAVVNQVINGITYKYVLDAGRYETASGIVSGKVLIRGDVVWYLKRGVSMAFGVTDSITITNNGRLRLYVASPTANLPDVVNNATPDKFIYFGLPTNSNINQQVNANFTGTFYAPSARLSLGGNGTGNEQKVCGALVVDSLNFQDHFSFHYDSSLARGVLSR